MKRIYRLKYLILAICVLISDGCDVERSSHSKALSAIDSVADVSPRRALAMLDSIGPKINAADKADRNYYDLLRIKTEDKLYVAHTTDTLMLRLLDYYENEGDKRLLPMAYYYAGRVYYDMNDGVRALPYFQKAVEFTDSTNLLRYKAYSQIGYLFLYQGLYDKAIEAFHKSYTYYKRKGNTINQAYVLCGMAYGFQRSNREIHAFKCFKQALQLVRESGNKSFEAEVLGQIAYHYYNLKKYNIAEKYIEYALNCVDSLNCRPIYATAADIYSAFGDNDRAVLFNIKMYEMHDVYAKQASSKWLGHYYLHHDLSKATYYLQQYEKYSDSIQTIKQTEGVARIDAIYNYSQREKENAKLKIEIANRTFTVAIVLVLALTAIFVLVFIVFYLNRKRQIENRKLKNEKFYLALKYEQSRDFIEENNKKIDILEQRLANSTTENGNLVMALSFKEKQLKNLNKMANIREHNRVLAKNGLENSDICRKIFYIINDNSIQDINKKMPKEYWQVLDDEVNNHYNMFKEHILELCNISTLEYHVCLLLKIGVKPKGISVLVCKTKSSISAIRRRLYFRAFGKDEQPEKWDEFISSL